ncbi:hypothetical protein AA0113_g3368 [Alternaria arborescens]|uniref:Uncharacterized protein n=1 Tax=Alternaria arborescens TaxID=156630 RepID=A0A4Q4SHC8_9PLEO|nr:hypothetical protein AA0113_g3368 [Alternaria arborescens]
MAELKDNLGPYILEKALTADRAKRDCFVLDVSRDKNGNVVSSLEHVVEQVDDYLVNAYDRSAPVTKLYVVGEWMPTPPKKDDEKNTILEEQKQYANEPHPHTKPEKEWHDAGEQIAKLVQQMPALKELTWISGLPFMAVIWEKLSTSLTKLILDLGQPVRLQQDGTNEYKSYITPAEMRPLVQQTELEELRLFGMHDSLQSVYWETVFRNTSTTGMRVLDLNMAAPPIVRQDHWRKADNVRGLTVPKADSKEKEYKGVDGKGVLHYAFGTGEYLDDFSMRKGRIAAGLEEAKPLSLWCLKLDGFVVDYLPFEQELSRIALLTCGKDCIDSGLRAPKTPRTPHNRWAKMVNNATSHCLIRWPNWTGVFDDRGDQRSNQGDVVSQEAGLSTPAEEYSSVFSQMPLTKESLHMKDFGEALDGANTDDGYFSARPLSVPETGGKPSLSVWSNASTCGSNTTTPVVPSTARSSPKMPAVPAAVETSPAGESLIPVGSATTADSVVSNESSYDQVVPLDNDEAPNNSMSGAKNSFKHKIRRSWDWLSGSGFHSGAAS